MFEHMKQNSLDQKEITKFSKIADEWWDKNGKFRLLHEINYLRVEYISQYLYNQEVKKILDIGCGGGILSESMAKKGYQVTGIDPSEENIKIAQLHKKNLNICYKCINAEDFVKNGETFDVVLCTEVVEHVADIDSFIATCSSLLKKEGIIFLSTINRTTTSYLQAIIIAEYILRWLPRRTHEWRKFIKPSEMRNYLFHNNIKVKEIKGMKYSILHGDWELSDNVSVNYILAAQKQ